MDDLHFLAQSLSFLTTLKHFSLALLPSISQSYILEFLERESGDKTRDIIEPHSYSSVIQNIKDTIFRMFFKMVDPHPTSFIAIFPHVGGHFFAS